MKLVSETGRVIGAIGKSRVKVRQDVGTVAGLLLGRVGPGDVEQNIDTVTGTAIGSVDGVGEAPDLGWLNNLQPGGAAKNRKGRKPKPN